MDWKNRTQCGQISEQQKGQTVTLYGWIDTVRDHGHLLFAHIRDISGISQLVFDPEKNKPVHNIAQKLRSEFVVEIQGTIEERSDDTKNPHIPTGNLEIVVDQIKILSEAKTPPFLVTEKDLLDESQDEHKVDEDVRLTYRYLDLRRPSLQHRIVQRSKFTKIIRDYLSDRQFHEIETPVLTKSTPEGARDYLVPSRVHPEEFYALPQSPQLFKQMLMMGGFDRYFQIARCFRDEDLRPNRQPEFTQVDIEASFINESFIYELIEGLIQTLFEAVDQKISTPFPHMTYEDAMTRYGNDHPDLRFEMTFTDVTSIFTDTNYKILKTIANKGGLIKAMVGQNMADQLGKNLLQNEFAMKLIPSFGGKGMTWMKVIDGRLQSNIVQFFSEAEQQQLLDTLNAKDGDVIFIVADTNHHLVNDVLGRFRLYLADRQGLIPDDKISLCWITDFPLFEKKDGRLTAIHHPFTLPAGDISSLSSESDWLSAKAQAYDVVLNGEEIGGGSLRIHSPQIQQKIFEVLGLSANDIEQKFGFFVRALDYGTPPHGGIALGLDRLVSLLLGVDAIRDVIAFPKNRAAACPLTQAPSTIADHQRRDLHL